MFQKVFLIIMLFGNLVFSQDNIDTKSDYYHFLQYQIIYQKGTVKKVNLVSHKKVKTIVKEKNIPFKTLLRQLVFKVLDDGTKGPSIVDYVDVDRRVEHFDPNGKIERMTISNDTIYKLIRIKVDKHQHSLVTSIYDPNHKEFSKVFSTTPL
ncbi:MAG: hypothetical protein P8P33_02070 [Flavobacteriaceae bacterium]|nr:hypothetical protein [Flavobacteriaceae bacterium]